MRIPAGRMSLVEHAQRPYAAMFRLEQSIELDRGLRDLVASVATRLEPGHYQPGAVADAAA